MTDLPVVGAAMPSADLDLYAEWLIADQRDLELQDPVSWDLLDDDWSTTVAEIRAKLDGYSGRMGVHGPFRGLPMDAPDPKIRTVIQERFKQGLDFAAEIGATHMVVHSPFHALGHFRPGGEQYNFNNAMDTLAEVVPHAEQVGCALVIETIFDYNPNFLASFVRSFDSDFVKMSIDVGHAFIMHTVADAPAVDYFVHIAGDKLGHLHLQDTDGYSDRHWTPGEGNINWVGLFEALAKLDHSPRLIIETERHRDPRKAAAYFEDIGVAR